MSPLNTDQWESFGSTATNAGNGSLPSVFVEKGSLTGGKHYHTPGTPSSNGELRLVWGCGLTSLSDQSANK